MSHQRSGQPNTRGFTLIEVLVALIVISVGLLGLAGMKASSMQSTYGSYGRTQAVTLAYAIVDRMRANRDAALAQAYDNDFTDGPPGCSSTDAVADCDLDAWLRNVASELPDGEGAVEVAADGTATVETRWDPSRVEGGLRAETGGAATSTEVTFTVRTQL